MNTTLSTGLPLTSATATAGTWSHQLSDHVTAFDLSSDGRWIVAGSSAGEAVVLDAGDGRLVATLPEHQLGVLCAAFAPDGSRVAVGGADGKVVMSRPDGTTVASVHGNGWANALAWQPGPDSLLAVGVGRAVRLVEGGGWVLAGDHSSTVTALSWASNGRRLAAASYGGVELYDPERSGVGPVRSLAWKGSILALAHSPDGKWLVSGNQDASVHLWRLAGTDELEMAGYPAKIERLAFAPDGRWLAVAGVGDVTLWDMRGKGPGGRRPVMLDGHRRRVSALAWSRDGSLLASGSPDRTVLLWDPRHPRQPQVTLEVDDEVTALQWGPEVTALFVGTTSGAVRRYDLEEQS